MSSKTESGRQAVKIETLGHLNAGNRFSFNSAYAKFSLVLLVITVISLLPHYVKLVTTASLVSNFFIFHGFVFLGWYILFSAQASLVAARNIATHMKLGYLSLGLAVVLVASGAHMLLGVMSAYQADWSPGYLFSRASFVWAIAHTLASFTLLYIAAISYRRKSDVHRRLMMLATLSMMSASITRVAYLPFVPIDGTALTLLLTYGLLITPMIIDKMKSGAVHSVYKWGVPFYIVTQLLFIAMLPTTELGRRLAFPF